MKNRNYLIFALCIIFAGILSSCDPMAFPYLIVNQVIIADNSPYIHVSQNQSWGVGCCIEDTDLFFVSKDYGKTWKKTSFTPAEKFPTTNHPEEVKKTECVANDTKVCYRITGLEQVEISKDSGKTWQIDWKMPLGRKKYMARNPDITHLEKVTPDTIPFDLGILSMDNSHVVIVAMGNQGVLVKSSSGLWERYAVPFKSELGKPLPFYASSFKEAVKSLVTETVWLFLLIFFVFVYLSFSTWGNISKNINQIYRRKIWQSYLPFFIASAGFLGFVFLLFASLFIRPLEDSPLGEFLLDFLSEPSVAICFVPIIGLLISWLFIIAIIPSRKIGLLAGLASIGYTIAFGIGTYSPLMLWAFGVIPIYEIAFVISILLGILTIVLGLRYEKRLAIQATSQETL